MPLSAWIRTNRTRCEWTQQELAVRLQVDLGCVSRWERGIHNPNVLQFKRLCELFVASADEALGLPTRKRSASREARA